VSGRAARPTIRRHEWLLAGIAALVAFVVPLTVVGWLDDPQPEIRVLGTDQRLSTLVIDGDSRILIVNTDNREAAGAFLGRIAQPWESKPQTIVASASEEAAIGLWEALQRLEPSSVIIAGIPGADPLWAAIEDECTRRQIDLHYVSDRATITTDRLSLTVFGAPPEIDTGRGVVIRRGPVSVLVALDAVPPRVEAQALIFNGDPAPATPDLVVTSDDSPRTPSHHEVLVGDLRAVRLVIEEDVVRVFGGVLRPPKGR
jgi:hypothetical protein